MLDRVELAVQTSKTDVLLNKHINTETLCPMVHLNIHTICSMNCVLDPRLLMENPTVTYDGPDKLFPYCKQCNGKEELDHTEIEKMTADPPDDCRYVEIDLSRIPLCPLRDPTHEMEEDLLEKQRPTGAKKKKRYNRICKI